MLEDGLEDATAIEARRQKLLARLEKKRQDAKTSSVQSQKKSDDLELDQLLATAAQEVAEGKVCLETVTALERSLPQSKGRMLQRVQDALEALRRATLTANAATKPSGFSFSRKSVTKSEKKVEPETVKEEEASEVHPQSTTSPNSLTLEDKKDLSERIEGKDGQSVALKNISGCTLRFQFSPSAVHMQNIIDCTIVFPDVESSLLIYSIERSKIFAIAQQIRLHDAIDVELHVAVRGAVIMEGCKQVQLAPYLLTNNGERIETPPGDQWRQPRDFDWLAQGQSPNWSILPEDRWRIEDL